jgi:molybdopterin converting factor small subunit
LRVYAEGQSEVEVQGETVGEALDRFIEAYPDIRQHLFNGQDELRPYVNLFVNDEEMRQLEGLRTRIDDRDRLMIIPSIAGGSGRVDHSALRTNQAAIILLNLVAFILNAPWLALFVALLMALGTALKTPGFGFIYRRVLKPAGWVKPDVLLDNPEPHLFAQGFGAFVTLLGGLALYAGYPVAGWALVWLVIALAALNLFAGFCAGCAVYYWLNRLNVAGFTQSPPEGTFPGTRPKTRA